MPPLRLLDLFCGAGGAGMGYHRSGFIVVGVDNKPQPRYPFEFHREDAFAFLEKHGNEFDVIHASPPCQAYSVVTPNAYRAKCDFQTLPIIRSMLIEFGKPFVLENVRGAQHLLLDPIFLCGSMFGLRVWRHRYFEIRPEVLLPSQCQHVERPIDVSGTGGRRINRRPDDHGGNTNKPRTVAEARAAIGIDWMSRYEISQAIPPAYTEWIGRQLLAVLKEEASCPTR